MNNPNRKNFLIYALTEPNSHNIRYIGKTNNLTYRLRRHINESKKGRKLHKCNWIKGLLAKNDMFGYIILETNLTNSQANKREVEIIKELRDKGVNLTNQTDGGGGACGYKHSEEAIAKLKKYGEKYKKSKEFKEKLLKYHNEKCAIDYKKIRDFKNKNPKLSNNKIAKALGFSNPKIAKALKKNG